MSKEYVAELKQRLAEAERRIQQLESILQRQAASLPGTVEELAITDQVRLELKESRDKYRKLFNYANDAMFVISLDKESPDFGHFSDVNNVACKRLGYTRDELLQKTPFDISSPEDFVHNKQMLRKLNEEGSVTFETTYLRKDGSPMPVEINALRLTIDGRDLYMAIARDIRDRKLAEAQLKERERLYRLLADNVHDIIWTTDCGLIPNFVSPSFSRQTSLPQSDAARVITTSILRASPFYQRREMLAELSADNALHWEASIETGDDRTIWVESIATPLLDANQCFAGIMGVTRDISARKNMIWQLEAAKEAAYAASRAKSNFLANMSHEVRTPMNGVLGMLQLLKLTSPTQEQMEYIDTAMVSGKSLLTIINDILDYSKIEAGKLQLTPEDFEIREMVDTLLTSFSTAIDQERVSISAEVAHDVPQWILADPVRIRQIFFNLLGNAVKFTEQGSIHITLTSASLPEDLQNIRLHCTIDDTGIGIPEEIGERIFDPFTQLDTRRHPSHKGTGLGLSIVRQLLNQMGGSISLHRNPAGGTTVRFDLIVQVSKKTRQPDEVPSAHPVLTSPNRQLHTLLVEDELINQQILQAILTKLGHRTVIATDGASALNILKDQSFDIILMDVQMPGMDGLETTMRIRNDDAFSHVRNIPIIALTAYAMAGDKDKCLKAGMNSYLAKPVDIKVLNKLLQQLTRSPSPPQN